MKHIDTWIYCCLLIAANAGLLLGQVCINWIYYPDLACAGQIHRFWTAPFVHVSWLHLLLDGSAFLMLILALGHLSLGRRVCYVVGAHLCCMAFVTAALPFANSIGYSGLSGIAHGLTVIWALDIMTDKSQGHSPQLKAALTLGIVVSKALFEAFTGHVVFTKLYFGQMGHPIAVSHLGGIVGALVAWFFMTLSYPRPNPVVDIKMASGYIGFKANTKRSSLCSQSEKPFSSHSPVFYSIQPFRLRRHIETEQATTDAMPTGLKQRLP